MPAGETPVGSGAIVPSAPMVLKAGPLLVTWIQRALTVAGSESGPGLAVAVRVPTFLKSPAAPVEETAKVTLAGAALGSGAGRSAVKLEMAAAPASSKT